MEVKILGVSLGTASGWDESADWGLMFYDFKPSLSGIPEGDLFVDLQSGELEIYEAKDSEEGDATVLMSVPAFGLLKQYVEHA